MTQDVDCKISKYCFVSESCIPIYPLNDLLDGVLMMENSSWINYTNVQNDGFAWQKQVCII